MRRLLPEARRADIEEGIISRPDLTAGVIRSVLAETRSAG
jgi:hypothetical protein